MADQQAEQASLGRRTARTRIIALVAGLLPLLAASPVVAASDQSSPDVVARGKYLALLGDCGSCHTAYEGKEFAGGRYMPTPFGPISTPNITPDKETGIGNWTDDDFYRVLHSGIGKNGEHIYPVMPYPWFTKVTHEDVLAIKAYLFSLAPVHSPRPPNKLAFPFNIRAGLAVWQAAFLVKGPFVADPSKSAEINRGAYIVQGLAHCGECHNGRNLLGDTTEAEPLRGGPIQHWYAPNITSDVKDGIGKFSDDQVFSFLKTGVAEGMGVVAGPMAETVHDSLSKLTDADVHAIVAYLKSTPAESSYVSEQQSAFTGTHPAGQDIYLNNCASCHQVDGKGLPGAVPALAGNGAVVAYGPDDIIRVVLAGIEAQQSYASMPAVAADMTDQQIADVTNYIRQSWGNKAPPNADAGEVSLLRSTSFSGMNIGPDGHCGKVVQPELAGFINDPKNGVDQALQSMTKENVLQTAESIVAKVKAAAPQAKRADIVNSLTLAYCPIVRDNAKVPGNMKVSTLDNFSDRVYSVVKSHGNE